MPWVLQNLIAAVQDWFAEANVQSKFLWIKLWIPKTFNANINHKGVH